MSDYADYEKDDEEVVAVAPANAGTRARCAYNSGGHAAVCKSRGAQKIANLQPVDKLRHSVLSTIPRLYSCQNPVDEAGSTMSGALSSQTGEGLYS